MQRPQSNIEHSTSNDGRRSLAGRWAMKAGRLFAFFAMVLPATCHACAVCGGATDEHIIEASNTVLWALLGLVFFVFAATGATVWFWRKAHTPIPAHIALIESLSSEDLTAD